VHQVVPYLIGGIGLFFTNRPKQEVVDFFATYSHPDYARSGNIAQQQVTIPVGPLEQFQHTMEPQLRKLGKRNKRPMRFCLFLLSLSFLVSSGLHTSLKKGIVHLDVAHDVCKKGDKLTPEQARLLKLFEHMQAEFKVKLRAAYSKSGEPQFEVLDTSVDEGEQMSLEDNEESASEAEEDQENLPKTKKLKNKKTEKDLNNN